MLVDAIAATFYKPASGHVSCYSQTPNDTPFSTWVRANAGEIKTKTSGTATVGGVTNRISATLKTKYKGIQAGFDGAKCNIDGGETTVHVGFTAGVWDATARQQDVAGLRAKLSTVFVGGYAAYAQGDFTADLSGRYDYHKIDLSHVDPNIFATGEDVNNHTVSGSFTAAYNVNGGGAFSLSPSAGLSVSHASLDEISIQGTASTAEIKTKNSVIGFVGLNAQMPYVMSDELTVTPFVSVKAFNQFIQNTKSEFTAGNAVVDVETKRSGTWGQISAGSEFMLLSPDGEAGTSAITGALRFDGQYGKRLEGWGVTARLRVQF